MGVVASIPRMTTDARRRVFLNALGLLRTGERAVEARVVLTALQDVWRQEAKGVDEAVRRQILDFVMRATLQHVGTAAHYASWGAPQSRERFAKLRRDLQSFATGSRHRQDTATGNLLKAKREWDADIRWLNATWRERVS